MTTVDSESIVCVVHVEMYYRCNKTPSLKETAGQRGYDGESSILHVRSIAITGSVWFEHECMSVYALTLVV